jgi:hypothetical protein
MDSKLWFRKALSLCLSVAILATYTTVALAVSGKTAGELTVSGIGANGEAPFVLVNGEAAKSGRSIFSSSTISTPDQASAVISMGNVGQVQLAPNSSMTLSFGDTGITGGLNAGSLTVLGSSQPVIVNTPDGKTLTLNAGETASANGARAQADDDDHGGGKAWWALAGILGAAAIVIVWTATSSNDVTVGGGGTVISPNR